MDALLLIFWKDTASRAKKWNLWFLLSSLQKCKNKQITHKFRVKSWTNYTLSLYHGKHNACKCKPHNGKCKPHNTFEGEKEDKSIYYTISQECWLQLQTDIWIYEKKNMNTFSTELKFILNIISLSQCFLALHEKLQYETEYAVGLSCAVFHQTECYTWSSVIPYWNVLYNIHNFATFSSLVTIHKKEWSYILFSY